MGAGGEAISTFKIWYIDSLGNRAYYTRTAPTHHTAGFIATTVEGTRYTYGIPAYNRSQEETVFSAKRNSTTDTRVNVGGDGHDPTYKYDGTDKYLKRVNMPQYAHAYLLTSIVGPDYVDVTGDGVTEDDLGYWVKFTYQRTTSDYQWRDPYSRAHLQKGWRPTRAMTGAASLTAGGSNGTSPRRRQNLTSRNLRSKPARTAREEGAEYRIATTRDAKYINLHRSVSPPGVGLAASLPAIKTVKFESTIHFVRMFLTALEGREN